MGNTQQTTPSAFDAAFDEADAAGETRQLIPRPYKFAKESDKVTGILVRVEDCMGENDVTYKRYILDLGTEHISLVCGAQVDAILGDGRHLGKLVRITYLGKEALSKGRTMNKYDVRMKP